MQPTRPRLIAYVDPVERLHRELIDGIRRNHLRRDLRRSWTALSRYRAAVGGLDGWHAIAASVVLEAAFQVGRRRDYFAPREQLAALN